MASKMWREASDGSILAMQERFALSTIALAFKPLVSGLRGGDLC